MYTDRFDSKERSPDAYQTLGDLTWIWPLQSLYLELLLALITFNNYTSALGPLFCISVSERQPLCSGGEWFYRIDICRHLPSGFPEETVEHEAIFRSLLLVK